MIPKSKCHNATFALFTNENQTSLASVMRSLEKTMIHLSRENIRKTDAPKVVPVTLVFFACRSRKLKCKKSILVTYVMLLWFKENSELVQNLYRIF